MNISRRINRKLQLIIIQLLTLSFLLIPSIITAQDFTAKTLNDYGNVTVMEVTGNYDAKNPDGSNNNTPRQAIAKEFFKTHKDEYDFLVIFSNFDFKMPESETRAFYLHVKNDVHGIGSPIIDNSALFGSNGKLQGTIDMGNVLTHATNPIDPKFEDPLDTLSHEVMHRWAAYVKFKDSSGNISNTLLGSGAAHWSFLLNSFASLMYGNQWQDNGDGTFTSINARKYYSPLDLYLMGFYDKTQVPPMLLINNPAVDPTRASEIGATISGVPQYVTIDDIIAVEGERIPNSANSQKTFKTAFIFITTPGTFTGDELYGIENIRNGWITRFSVLTDGKGLMQVASTLQDNLPTNPGIIPPSVTPRTLPPNIEDGVRWLLSHQQADGSWRDMSQTSEKDTAEVVLALKDFDFAAQNYASGIQWLGTASYETTDYLSRRINAFVDNGQDVIVLINELASRQNADGGWGGYNHENKKYPSNPTDTSLALRALAKAGYSGQTVISKAIDYLKSTQNADGGWGTEGGSTIESTVNVLSVFNKYRTSYQLEDQITKGVAWLSQRQNPDGGFGNSPSTVYDSALAVMTLKEFEVPQDSLNKGLNYILNNQSADGSWNESPYQTALAINAVWKATVD
ncbi:MAG TPA: prenyltransferase/squalene oxidase repeat-containing protein, partial [Thermodesulfovibrionales bacterium]|nr:prenyltransferase/squalene oxidase repeat-containing protein [Thermodesulfovibrionales bacterium]